MGRKPKAGSTPRSRERIPNSFMESAPSSAVEKEECEAIIQATFGKDYYEIEGIRDKRRDKKGKIEYLVKWKNYPEEDNSWEPYRNVKTCVSAIREFEQRSLASDCSPFSSSSGRRGRKRKENPSFTEDNRHAESRSRHAEPSSLQKNPNSLGHPSPGPPIFSPGEKRPRSACVDEKRKDLFDGSNFSGAPIKNVVESADTSEIEMEIAEGQNATDKGETEAKNQKHFAGVQSSDADNHMSSHVPFAGKESIADRKTETELTLGSSYGEIKPLVAREWDRKLRPSYQTDGKDDSALQNTSCQRKGSPSAGNLLSQSVASEALQSPLIQTKDNDSLQNSSAPNMDYDTLQNSSTPKNMHDETPQNPSNQEEDCEMLQKPLTESNGDATLQNASSLLQKPLTESKVHGIPQNASTYNKDCQTLQSSFILQKEDEPLQSSLNQNKVTETFQNPPNQNGERDTLQNPSTQKKDNQAMQNPLSQNKDKYLLQNTSSPIEDNSEILNNSSSDVKHGARFPNPLIPNNCSNVLPDPLTLQSKDSTGSPPPLNHIKDTAATQNQLQNKEDKPMPKADSAGNHIQEEVPSPTNRHEEASPPYVPITCIRRAVNYCKTTSNGKPDVSVTFMVQSADGQEVLVDNKFLRLNYPILLIDFYEQHLRYNN